MFLLLFFITNILILQGFRAIYCVLFMLNMRKQIDYKSKRLSVGLYRDLKSLENTNCILSIKFSLFPDIFDNLYLL